MCCMVTPSGAVPSDSLPDEHNCPSLLQGDNVRTAIDAQRFVQSLKFSGMTPLGTQ
jgi:hypothetical protein